MKTNFIYLLAFLFALNTHAQFPKEFPNGVKLPNAIEAANPTRIPSMDSEGKVNEFVLPNLSSFIDDIGAVEGVLPLSVLLDPVNGDDATGELEKFARPFKTFDALIDALPLFNGETYSIYITGGTIPINRRIEVRNLDFIAYSNTILDFTDLKEEDGVTDASFLFKDNSDDTQANWTFKNKNISIVSNFSGKKAFSWNTSDSDISVFGTIKDLNIKSTGSNSNKGSFVFSYNSDFRIINLYDSSQDRINLQGQILSGFNKGKVTIDNYFTEFGRTLFNQVNEDTEVKNITRIGTSAFNLTLGLASENKIKIGDVDINGVLKTGIKEVEFDSDFSTTTTVWFTDTEVIKGKINSTTYAKWTGIQNSFTFDGFEGKIAFLTIQPSVSVTIKNNSIIETTSFAFNFSSENSNTYPVIIQGFNTITQSDTSSNLFNVGSSVSNINILIKGALKTNAKTLGNKTTVFNETATFKEKLNEIVVRDKRDIVNRDLDSKLTYIIDGNIELLSGEYIWIPATNNGLSNFTLNGYGLEASKITKNVPGESIFASPVGGSAGMQVDAIKFVMGTPTTTCLNVVDENGFNALEFTKVNFEGSGSIGKVDGYRQMLWTNIGLFGLGGGLQFEGNWLGGFRSETVIVRNLTGTTGVLFNKGTSFTMNSRFFADSNVDLPTGWAISDFEPTNFTKDNLFQLQGMLVTRNGIINTLDANYFPNIDETEDVSIWKDNIGIRNTYIGGKWSVSSELATNITTVNTYVKVAGDVDYIDLQHFSDGGDENSLTSTGSLTKDVTVRIQGIVNGGANDEIGLRLAVWDDSASAYVFYEPVIQTINNALGGDDVSNFSYEWDVYDLGLNDRTELHGANLTDTTNFTIKSGFQLVSRIRN